jgi:replicative DNA helicase
LTHDGRVPPNDLDAEAAVLSACILSPQAFDEVADILNREKFYSPANGLVFGAIVALRSDSKPVDVLTLKSWLAERNDLQTVGGVKYLAELIDAVPSVANVQEYARIVIDKSRQREMITTSQRIAAEGYGEVGDVGEWIDRCEQAMFRIASERTDSQPEPIGDVVRAEFKRIEIAAQEGRPTGHVVSFGLGNLDKVGTGAQTGELVIVAARPGVGKSALADGWAVSVADKGQASGSEDAALVFSLEMPREQVCKRLLCTEAGVDSRVLIKRPQNLTAEDWSRLAVAAQKLTRTPVWVDDDTDPTVVAIRAKARRVAASAEREGKRLRMVVVDYLQLMGVDSGIESREQQVAANSRGLKKLAKDLDVVVVALSQMNRRYEQRGKDAEPQLSDLRESGAIEQDADQVIFLHANGQDPEGVVTVIGAKSRTFGTWRTKLHFDAVHTRFLDYDEDSAPPPDARGW